MMMMVMMLNASLLLVVSTLFLSSSSSSSLSSFLSSSSLSSSLLASASAPASFIGPATTTTTTIRKQQLKRQQYKHQSTAPTPGRRRLLFTNTAATHNDVVRSSLSSSSSSRLSSLTALRSSSSQENVDNTVNDNDNDNDEWHPHDPASTIAELMVGIWDQIIMACSLEKRGDTMTVIYPNMIEQFNKSPRFINMIMAHLDVCRDVCDDYGTNIILQPYYENATPDPRKGIRPGTKKITGFTAKTYRSKSDRQRNELNNNYEFGYDPMWPDDDEMSEIESIYSKADDIEDYEDNDNSISATSTTSTKRRHDDDDDTSDIARIPDNDDIIIDTTKTWVNTMMSNMGICPFSVNANRAGLPVGDVYYTIDRSNKFEDVYVSFWKEVVRLESSDEKKLATTLLIVPEFCIDYIESYDSFSTTLTNALSVLDGIEDLIQLVFFHPQYVFRDGEARALGGTASANYARRSPWPMINLLRTKQVRNAQKGIPTGLVYKQNEKTLSKIGVQQLEYMLQRRNWDDILSNTDMKVNRKEIDALKIASNYQTTGVVDKRDISFQYDTTPKASTANLAALQQSDLVNVILQALEKRIGISKQQQQQDSSASTTSSTPTAAAADTVEAAAATLLNGPETSATSMAVDALIEYLRTTTRTTSKTTTTKPPSTTTTTRTTTGTAEADNSNKNNKNNTSFPSSQMQLSQGVPLPQGVIHDDDDDDDEQQQKDPTITAGSSSSTSSTNQQPIPPPAMVNNEKEEEMLQQQQQTESVVLQEEEEAVEAQEDKEEELLVAVSKEEDENEDESQWLVLQEEEESVSMPEELLRAKEQRMFEAKRALIDDITVNDLVDEDGMNPAQKKDLSDILFGGKTGIPDRFDDDLYQEGMNPDSFY